MTVCDQSFDNPTKSDSFSTGTNLTGLFITGTDTDVGKTYVSGCIAHTLIENGLSVIPRKPIASGCIKQPGGSLLCDDALFLQQSCQSLQSLDEICPNQFEPPISPQTAIEQAGLFITTQDLLKACKPPENPDKNTLYLIEGAGGFFSPLCSDGLNKDLAKALNLPVVLVVKNQLGCINHTLLTLDAIERAGLNTLCIVLNFTCETNHAEGLNNWTDIPVFKIPFNPSGLTIPIQGLTHIL